ncbi:hypothetical protein [Pedobacter sp.]
MKFIFKKFDSKIITIFVLFFIQFLLSCKINQYRNWNRVGKWIETREVDGVKYKFVGHYKMNGYEKGVWRNYANNVLVSKEIYINDTCHTTNYRTNGTVVSSGKTITDRSGGDKLRWYYIGQWKYFDDQGDLEFIRFFVNGRENGEIKIEKKSKE